MSTTPPLEDTLEFVGHRRKLPIRPVVTAIVIIGVLFSVVGWVRSRNNASTTQYVVQKASRGNVRKVVSATGTVQPWTVVDIKSKAGGRVNELLVELGDRVKKDQVIAKIDPSDSQLSVSTAQADITGAVAKVKQSQATYTLQLQQTSVGISNAKASVDSAQANLAAAEARYRTAVDQYKSQPVQTSALVRAAEANYETALEQRKQLIMTQSYDQASAKATYDQAVASNRYAEMSYNRQKQLLEKGYVSRQSVDQAESSYVAAKAQLNAATERMRTLEAQQNSARLAQDATVSQVKAQLASVKSQPDVQNKKDSVQEAKASVQQAAALLGQAKESLKGAYADKGNNSVRYWDISSAQATTSRAKATLQNAADTLSQTTVRAPSDGVVLQKYVEQGTIITSGMSMNSTGTSIVQIGDVSRLYVNVTVDETDIASVSLGQNVDVSIDAYPDEKFEGKVTRISPQAAVEQNVTTVAVRVEIANTSKIFSLIKPNMNATCEFIVGNHDNVVNVPTEAVHSDDRGSYVDVASGGTAVNGATQAEGTQTLINAKIERRVVTVGISGTDNVEIASGLNEGDRVVTETIDGSSSDTTTKTKSPISSGGPGGGGPPPGGGGRGR
jgi:HlyD family secretion protein